MLMRKAIFFPLAGAMAVFAAALSAGERPDPRTRTFVEPVRAWGSIETATLTAPKFGQVAEGEFLVGSGPVLKRGEWVVLDFGRELHGGVQLGSGRRAARTPSRIFGSASPSRRR